MKEFYTSRWEKVKIYPLKRPATAAAYCHIIGAIILMIGVFSFDLLEKEVDISKIGLCVLVSYAIEAYVLLQWRKIAEKTTNPDRFF